MDFATSAGAVIALVFNVVTAVKGCADLCSRYREVDTRVQKIQDELGTLEGALRELGILMMNDASAVKSRWDSDKALPVTFSRTLNALRRTIDGLHKEMNQERTGDSPLKKMDKAKYLWGENDMERHLIQLRGQSANLNLLLNVVQTSVSPLKLLL
jgi:hypothetical protein